MKKHSNFKRYFGFGALVLVTALLAALPMLTAKEEDDGPKASILSAVVQDASIDRVLYGGGPLESGEVTAVTVPEGVKITELLAANGDVLKAGDPIAKVDPVSVMSAVKAVQDTLDTVRDDLKAAADKVSPGVLTVDSEGRVCSNGKPIAEDRLSNYADYLRLSVLHRDYEQILLELFRLNRSGSVTAPVDGMVDGLDKSIVSKLGFSGEVKVTLLAVHTPDGSEEDDGESYTGYAGVVTAVSETEWSLMMSPMGGEITDFADLSAVTTDTGLMTQPGTHAAVTVFTQSGGAWQTVEAVQTGDILIFAYGDGGTEWVLKAGAALQDKPEDNPGQQQTPTIPGNVDIGSLIGAMGGMRGGNSSAGSTPSLYSTQSTAVCTLVPQETMQVTIAIDEQDIASVREGMTAELTFDALPGQNFTGTVTEISKFGSGNGGSSKFDVALELPYSEGMLPGMNAAVSITLETAQPQPTIPVAALVERGNETLVYTGFDAKTGTLLNPVSVETGLSDGKTVQILSGLESGTPVWYSYYDTPEISNAVEQKGLFG